eukprot:8556819-Pyramimonas_sp.AAC.1
MGAGGRLHCGPWGRASWCRVITAGDAFPRPLAILRGAGARRPSCRHRSLLLPMPAGSLRMAVPCSSWGRI